MQKRTHIKKQSTFLTESKQILRTVQVDNRIYKRRLTALGSMTSSGIGVLNTVFTMDPSVTGDWASCSALYDEFRVVGVRLRILSKTQNTVTLASNLVVICYDNDDSTALVSLLQATEYQNMQVIPALWNDHHVFMFNFARPSAGTETSLPWQDIATPALSTGGIKVYSDNLSTSTQYFTFVIEYAVEFRGVR